LQNGKKKNSYALSRFDILDTVKGEEDGSELKGESARYNKWVAPISQDAWVVGLPVPQQLIDKSSFLMGKPGCDNKIAYELKSVIGNVTNPVGIIVARHVHSTGKRNYDKNDVLPGPYALCPPAEKLF